MVGTPRPLGTSFCVITETARRQQFGRVQERGRRALELLQLGNPLLFIKEGYEGLAGAVGGSEDSDMTRRFVPLAKV